MNVNSYGISNCTRTSREYINERNNKDLKFSTGQGQTFHLKQGGIGSIALSDGSNITAYKADDYTRDTPNIKLLVTDKYGRTKEKIVNTKMVDPAQANDYEMFALNADLVEQKKLDNTIYHTHLYGNDNFTEGKKNFMDIVSENLEMQLQAGNLTGYTKYNKILNSYKEINFNSNPENNVCSII